MEDDYRPPTWQEEEAFKHRLKHDPETGCHNWTGATQAPGKRRQLPYAIVQYRGKQMHGHRLAMMFHLGGPIPDGRWVLHSCHNATCCNPDHLRLGTPRDNFNDMVAAGRNRNSAIMGKLGDCVSPAEVKEMHRSGLRLNQILHRWNRWEASVLAAFDREGLPHPERRRLGKLDRERTLEIAAMNMPSLTAYARATGHSRTSIRDAFHRYGVPRPTGYDPIPKYDDDYWRNLASLNLPSMKKLTRDHGHDRRTVIREFARLGLPLPRGIGGRQPYRPQATTPTNPTKGA